MRNVLLGSCDVYLLSLVCRFLASRSINGRSKLVIDDALKRDDGTYMCVAENAAGSRRALAAVRVKGQILCHSTYFSIMGVQREWVRGLHLSLGFAHVSLNLDFFERIAMRF